MRRVFPKCSVYIVRCGSREEERLSCFENYIPVFAKMRVLWARGLRFQIVFWSGLEFGFKKVIEL